MKTQKNYLVFVKRKRKYSLALITDNARMARRYVKDNSAYGAKFHVIAVA